jgi:D-serine deaminase-like pyridoxal phosphate-dependent protein
MHLLSKSALALAVLGMNLATVLPAQAGNLTGKQQSAVSAVVSVYAISFIAVSPVLLVAGGSKAVGNSTHREKPAKAAALPPMAVQAVERQPDGGYHVALQRPEAPEQNALVDWPARPDNPAARLKVGDVLNFAPTDVGAGWTVHAEDGAALAFLPTPEAAATQASERW